MMLVDTHAHLQWKNFNEDLGKVLARARDNKVGRILNVGFDLEGSVKGVKLAEQNEELYAAVGIHPHNASQLSPELIETLKELADNPKVVAIGEIGLDYYRNLSPRDIQKEAFEAQILLAKELSLPIIVHNRDAVGDIFEIISKLKPNTSGVMHCFSESQKIAEKCIKLGFAISFAGTITYPNSQRLRKLAKNIDSREILVETDCPWLAPQEKRGKRNEPSFLHFTAQKMAELRGITLENLGDTTTRNAERIFKFK